MRRPACFSVQDELDPVEASRRNRVTRKHATRAEGAERGHSPDACAAGTRRRARRARSLANRRHPGGDTTVDRARSRLSCCGGSCWRPGRTDVVRCGFASSSAEPRVQLSAPAGNLPVVFVASGGDMGSSSATEASTRIARMLPPAGAAAAHIRSSRPEEQPDRSPTMRSRLGCSCWCPPHRSSRRPRAGGSTVVKRQFGVDPVRSHAERENYADARRGKGRAVDVAWSGRGSSRAEYRFLTVG